MTKKTRKVLVWLGKFIVACMLFFILRVTFDWILDGTPLANLNAYGTVSVLASVAAVQVLDAYADRHGLK